MLFALKWAEQKRENCADVNVVMIINKHVFFNCAILGDIFLLLLFFFTPWFPDDPDPYILKISADIIAEPIAHIFNTSPAPYLIFGKLPLFSLSLKVEIILKSLNLR